MVDGAGVYGWGGF
ncbi:general secretion pathway protein I, partial [Yersinia pestis PY-61]